MAKIEDTSKGKGIYNPDLYSRLESSTEVEKNTIGGFKRRTYYESTNTDIETYKTDLYSRLKIDEKKEQNSYSDSEKKLENLRLNPLKLVHYFYKLTDITAQNLSTKLTRNEIASDTGITYCSVKAALLFLLKNKYVYKVDSKPGKYGWIRYKLDNNLYVELKELNKLKKTI